MAAFVITLAFIGAAYGTLVAFNSSVTLDLGAAPTAGPGQSHLVAAAEGLLLLPDTVPAEGGELLFVPSGRQMREHRLREGAVQAVRRFVLLAVSRQQRPDLGLVDARQALREGPDGDPVAARDALLRLNTRIAEGRATVDVSAPALAALLRAAADACEEEADALGAFAADPSWLASPATEARMYQARGVAYGWRRLVEAALLDAPALAQATQVEAAIPLEALARAAERQPLVMFNGGPSAPWVPPHVLDATADFSRAAAGARALASALEQRAL